MTMSTASLLLPVFFAREFLAIDKNVPLKSVLGKSVYASWVLFGIAIFSGVLFHYLSAKWARLAWGKEVTFLWAKRSDEFIEKLMEASFWATVFGFFGGLMFIVGFFLFYPGHN